MEDVAVGAGPGVVGKGNVLLDQVVRDRVEGTRGNDTAERGHASGPGVRTVGNASRIQRRQRSDGAGNLLIAEDVAEVIGCGRVCGKVFSETPVEVGLRVNGDRTTGFGNDLTGSLIAVEEEELVPDDGAADGGTKDVLVVLGDGVGALAGGVEGLLQVVVRVEEGVAVELEEIAVEVVGALLKGGAHDAAGVAIVLGVLRTFDERKLVDGVQVGRVGESVQRDVVGVGAVDEVFRLLRLRAAGGVVSGEAVASGLHAGLNELEAGEGAVDQGQLDHLRGVHDVIELHVRGVDLDGVGGDLKGLRFAADFE